VDFVRRVRAMPLDQHIPVVMVSSERTTAKMDEALSDAGADAYICKPFTVTDVEQKLGRLIAGIGARPAPAAAAPAAAPAPRLGGFFSNLPK
jgi:CheY-like chemotaxis protein